MPTISTLGFSATGGGTHRLRENHAPAAASRTPAANQDKRAISDTSRFAAKADAGGAVKLSPSTNTTVTLSFPPAALAAPISCRTASSGLPAFDSTVCWITRDST